MMLFLVYDFHFFQVKVSPPGIPYGGMGGGGESLPVAANLPIPFHQKPPPPTLDPPPPNFIPLIKKIFSPSRGTFFGFYRILILQLEKKWKSFTTNSATSSVNSTKMEL